MKSPTQLGTQVISEVLYQVLVSHYQIKCLYHRVIFGDKIPTGPCSIKVSKSHPSSTRFYSKNYYQLRPFLFHSRPSHKCLSPYPKYNCPLPWKIGERDSLPYMFFTLRLLSFAAKWLNNLVYSSETEFDKGINRNKANFFQLLSCVRWRRMHPYRLQANKIYVFLRVFHSCFSHSFPGLKSWNACPWSAGKRKKGVADERTIDGPSLQYILTC